MQTRAILIDLFSEFGVEAARVGGDDLTRLIDNAGIAPREGDALVIRTGYSELLMGDPDAPPPDPAAHCATLNGRDARLQEFIYDSGIAAIAADNYAVETHPGADGGCDHHAMLPLHELCLFKLGIPLGELWYLKDLAFRMKDLDRSTFFLTAPPLRLPGGMGSPVTPVATL